MDNVEAIRRKFEAMGARLRVRAADRAEWRRRGSFTIGTVSDRNGELFDLNLLRDSVRFHVADARPRERHLLLVKSGGRDGLQKFLCGHDERHWFIAEVPKGAANVRDAMEALKPREVLASQRRHRVKAKNRNRRKNAAFLRQGEWFFIPVPGLKLAGGFVLTNEPIQRGMARPHIVEMLCRRGGRSVYVARGYDRPLTIKEHGELLKRKPHLRKLPWRLMRVQPEAYGRGRVRHPEHKTIVLPFWHRIVPNREVGRDAGGAPTANLFLD